MSSSLTVAAPEVLEPEIAGELAKTVEACLMACERSNQQCAPHAGHYEHCRVCSTATTESIVACRELLNRLRG